MDLGGALASTEFPQKDNREYFEAFTGLSESMLFVSFVGDLPIGVTAIYRDRNRMGMGLVGARILPDYREKATTHIIKSSLPFFRSAAIHSVDVLVNSSDRGTEIPFALNQEIQGWALTSLKEIGFEKHAQMYQHSLGPTSYDKRIKPSITWDPSPNSEGLFNLIWDTRDSTGVNCSQLWLAVDIAKSRGSLSTSSVNGKVGLAMSFETYGKGSVCGFLFSDGEIYEPSIVADEIVQSVVTSEIKSLEFHLMGEGQSDIIAALSDLCDAKVSSRELSLLRKTL
jgi:hypothetical protein